MNEKQRMKEQIKVVTVGRAEKGDLVIEMERRETGGLDIHIESTVKALFGRLIRQCIEGTLEKLGIHHLLIRVNDNGALDHVIQARVEAAARQLCTVNEPGALPEKKIAIPGSRKNRLRRTRLYLPGNNPDLALNAGLYGADCLILDLEDSVAPADKDAARVLVRNALYAIDLGASERIVRINPLSSGHGSRDLEMIVPAAPDTLLIPKCEAKEDVAAIEKILCEMEKRGGLQQEIFLMPLIESARGVLNAREIAAASERIVALCFGAEDFTADIGVARSTEGKESFVARSLIVVAAKAEGVQALDTVFSDVQDMDGLVASTKEAIALGFDGKGVIHPGQIKPIHQAFMPTPEQIENARQVLVALQEAEERGSGVAVLGSKMIDAPVVARAKKVLAMAEACDANSYSNWGA
jgi:citrate lyase subunit beta/citryl-CoA lyase